MLVQVYGDNALNKITVYKWVKHFSEGRESVTDEERSGRPETSRTEENIAKVRQIIRENRRLTVRSVAEQVNIDRETVKKLLTEDLDTRKACLKMVPKELTEEEKQRRVTICQDLLERQDSILGRAIAGDETWVYQYDPETKRQNAQWKIASSPRPKVPSVQIKSQNNVADFFFFILEGLFIMNLYQLDKQSTKFLIWKYWKGCVRRKRPELFANKSWILHHDDAPAHTALSVREFLATKQIIVLEHPAYSPDLAPCDFLFPKIKEILKERHFDDIDDIRSNTTAALKAIPQNHFQNSFEGRIRRWRQCIASQGDYFEGDHGGIQQ